MKYSIRLIVFYAYLCTSFIEAAYQENLDTVPIQKEIELIFTDFIKTANLKDTRAHMAFYAREPSLIFAINGTKLLGWDALEKQQLLWWDNPYKFNYALREKPSVTVLSPDFVLVTALMTIERISPHEKKRQDSIFTSVWQKRPEGWRIVQAHESFTLKPGP